MSTSASWPRSPSGSTRAPGSRGGAESWRGEGVPAVVADREPLHASRGRSPGGERIRFRRGVVSPLAALPSLLFPSLAGVDESAGAIAVPTRDLLALLPARRCHHREALALGQRGRARLLVEDFELHLGAERRAVEGVPVGPLANVVRVSGLDLELECVDPFGDLPEEVLSRIEVGEEIRVALVDAE